MEGEAVLRQYRAKGLAQSVGFGRRAALLVVDMIIGFTDPSSPLGSDLDRVVEAIRELLAPVRAAGLPVFYTTVAYEEEDCRDGGRFVEKVPSMKILRQGSPWVALDPRLGARSEEPLLVKKYASAFFGTDLDRRLKADGVDTLLVTGCTTSGCVRASVVDGMQYGYRVIVPEEAVGDRSRSQHEANLIDIQGKYGDVMPLAEVQKAIARQGVTG
jgi:maleamate amidohydrolase